MDDVDEADAPPLLSNSAGVYPIYFTDGPMQAVVYDFSESRLYTLTTIVSVLIGCFVLMCFMLSYNGRITRTIVTIAAEVEQIGRGDLTARLEKPRGNDELAGLTESVERMRAISTSSPRSAICRPTRRAISLPARSARGASSS